MQKKNYNQQVNSEYDAGSTSGQVLAPASPTQVQQTQKIVAFPWLIPVMVLMVVGATIYLSVRDSKVEYVYSLATACFGYYFGQLAPRNYRVPDEITTSQNEKTGY